MDALLADTRRARFWWGGILKPMFEVAIRTGHLRTKELWSLLFPLQRGPMADWGNVPHQRDRLGCS